MYVEAGRWLEPREELWTLEPAERIDGTVMKLIEGEETQGSIFIFRSSIRGLTELLKLWLAIQFGPFDDCDLAKEPI